MAFAMNRIGVNYHRLGNDEKSCEYNKKNIELSDFENIFAGYYNVGISLRNQMMSAESIEYFNKALDWSISKNVNSKLNKGPGD
jgi:tetratricopeptide (TPR) repeat protein